MNEMKFHSSLHGTIDNVFNNIPFYQELYSRYKISRASINNLESFKKLPITFKSDLRAHFPEGFLPKNSSLSELLEKDKFLRLHSSSGSGGDRLEILYSDRLASWPENINELWKPLKPINIFSRTAVLTSPICAGYVCHLNQKTYRERIKGQTLTLPVPGNLFSAKEVDFRQFHEEWEKFKPNIFLANPYYAVWMLEGCKRLNIQLSSPDIILTSYQYLTETHKKIIASFFKAPIYNYYSATDLGGSAIAFDTFNLKLQINSKDVFVEVIYPPQIKDRRYGFLAITTLKNPLFPLVRYVVGDLGSIMEGKDDKYSIQLAGRSKEALLMQSGKIIAVSDLDAALSNIDGLTGFQLRQIDQNNVQLNIMKSVKNVDEKAILKSVENLLNGELRVKMGLVQAVELKRSLKSTIIEPLNTYPSEEILRKSL